VRNDEKGKMVVLMYSAELVQRKLLEQ